VGTAAGTSTKVHETIVARALCAVVHSMSVQLQRDIARAVAASMIARYAAAVVEPFAVRFAGSNTSVNGSPTATPSNTALSTVPLTVNWIGAASAIPGGNGRQRAVSRVRIFARIVGARACRAGAPSHGAMRPAPEPTKKGRALLPGPESRPCPDPASGGVPLGTPVRRENRRTSVHHLVSMIV
jgi:hypothetical protein